MARKMSLYNVSFTPNANPQTIFQIVPGSNNRAVLHSIEIMPFGSTGTTAPLEFQLALQDGAGALGDDTSSLVKASPGYDESTLLTILKNAGSSTEPGSSVVHYTFSIHQQGVIRWSPPNREHIMEGGTRWGFRYVNAIFVPVKMTVLLEE